MKRVAGFLFAALISVTGCGKRAERPAAPAVKHQFGVNVRDRQLVFAQENIPLKPQASRDEAVISSVQWLGLSSQLMETGEELSGPARDRLLTMGHRLSQAFYGVSSSHTEMTALTNPPGNPFVEAAYFFGQPMMVKKLNEAITAAQEKVTRAADNTHIDLKDLSSDPLPEEVIQKVIDGLKEFKYQLTLLRDGTADGLIDKITGELDEKYLKDLQNLRESSRMDASRPLVDSLGRLERSLLVLPEISEMERQRLLIEVRMGMRLAGETRKLKIASDALQLLVDFWLSLDLRQYFPAAVTKLFAGLSDAQILALATENKAPVFSPAEWERFKKRTDYNFIPDGQIIAMWTKNNGFVLAPRDYEKIKNEIRPRLLRLVQTPEVASLVDRMAVVYPVTDPNERVQVLVSSWLGLSSRLAFPEDLKGAFTMFSDEDLRLLKSEPKYMNATTWLISSGHPKLAIARHKILLALETFGAKAGETIAPDKGIQNFRAYFDAQIVAATRMRLVRATRPIAETLTAQLKDTIAPTLEEQRKNGDKLATGEFMQKARYYVGKLIFGVGGLKKDEPNEEQEAKLVQNAPLPLLEKTSVHVKEVSNRLTGAPTDDVTSAEVLGLGLTNTVNRLQTLGTYESMGVDSRGTVAITFEALCKMLVLGGYRGYDSSLVESLVVPVTPGHQGATFDIKTYEPEKLAFATPDIVRIKNGFKLDRSSEIDPVISVAGQMELLRGYAQMMKYLKPWRTSSFDVGLGALRIEEDPTVKPFDREDFFLLSIGLSSVVLKNIPVKMLGLITDGGGYVEASKVADPDKLNVKGAVLTDYTPEKAMRIVTTKDTARSILAVSEFFDQIKDIENTSNPMLIEAFKTQPVSEMRKSLRKLMSGLILFATGKLMQPDGGFVSYYDADKRKLSSGPRLLEDQLLMARALWEAGRVLDSGFLRARAAENFFFLNNALWNPRLGFYNMREGVTDGRARLLDVARAIQLAHRIREYLPLVMTQGANLKDSFSQAARLEEYWANRFFSEEILQLSPIAQVMEFSL